MLIRGHPDFLILQWPGPSAARKRRIGIKPEVQGLWTVIMPKRSEPKIRDSYQGIALAMPQFVEIRSLFRG
jgi:hypothetical protein